MIGHHTPLRENDDLPLWRGPAVKKKPQLGCAMQYWGMTLNRVWASLLFMIHFT